MSGAHLSREFFELVKAIGESKSKQEEDRIIQAEVGELKKKIMDPSASAKKVKEYAIRLIYVEMLGHDASFGYIKTVELCARTDLLQKRIGYLAAGLMLSPEHEFRFMLVNQMQRDMKSTNHVEAAVALVALCKLITRDMIPAVMPIIVGLLKHEKENVRKKAVMALHRCLQLDPSSVTEHADAFRRALCDKDPSVMGAALNVFVDQTAENPGAYKDLVSSFVSVLKQITEHRLPRDFDYHRMPAPWIQIKLLKILGALGAADKTASEGMYEVLHDVMRRADTGINVGYAIIYECVRTVTTIYPNNTLLDAAAAAISRFITSDNHNLKYLGVTGLASIVKDHPQYAAEHQLAVMDCLESTDATLRRKTLDLLFRMTNPHNVTVIVEKMAVFLRATEDEFLRGDLVGKITQLAERFAPSNEWFLRTMNEVFECGGDMVPASVAENLMTLLAEGSGDDDADAALRASASDAYMALTNRDDVPDRLLQLMCWVLGEYGYTSQKHDVRAVQAAVSAIALRQHVSLSARAVALSAVAKLSAQVGEMGPEARAVCAAYSHSKHVDLQQRARELQALAEDSMLMQAVLPVDASCEDVEVDPTLPFARGFVDAQLAAGARAYSPPQDLDASAARRAGESEFRFDAYAAPETPSAPVGLGAMSAMATATTTGPFSGLDGPGAAAGAADGSPFTTSVEGGLNLSGVTSVWGASGFAGDGTAAGAGAAWGTPAASATPGQTAAAQSGVAGAFGASPAAAVPGSAAGVAGATAAAAAAAGPGAHVGSPSAAAADEEWEYVYEEEEVEEDATQAARKQAAASLFAGIAPAAAPRTRTVRKKVLRKRAPAPVQAQAHAQATTPAPAPAPASGGGGGSGLDTMGDLLSLGFGDAAPSPAPAPAPAAGGSFLDMFGAPEPAPAPSAATDAAGRLPPVDSLAPAGAVAQRVGGSQPGPARTVAEGAGFRLDAQLFAAEGEMQVVLFASTATGGATQLSIRPPPGLRALAAPESHPAGASAQGPAISLPAVAPGASAQVLLRLAYADAACAEALGSGRFSLGASLRTADGRTAEGELLLRAADVLRPIRISVQVYGQQWVKLGAGEQNGAANCAHRDPESVLRALGAGAGLHPIQALPKTGDGILAGRFVGSDVAILVYAKVARPGEQVTLKCRSTEPRAARVLAAIAQVLGQ